MAKRCNKYTEGEVEINNTLWKLLGLSLLVIIFDLSSATAINAVEITPSMAWSQTYSGVGDIAHSVIQTKDGGFLLLCSDWPSQDLQDFSGVFHLLKVDSSGFQQWNQTYTGTIFDIWSGQYVVQTADGGYAVTAEYQNKLLLLKTDQSGDPQWNQTYAGSRTCAASTLIQTSDGGFALVGVSNFDPIYGTSDTVWLVKTDSHGNQQWNQTLGTGKANSLLQTTDGGYAIASDPNFLLAKLDSEGSLQWNRTYVNRDKNSVLSVVQTSDGGYALGGWMWLRTNGGNENLAIVKTDTTGNMQWTQYYGAGIAFSMAKTNDDGFAIADDRLVKVNGTGSEQWEIGLGGQAFCVVQTQDGSYVIAGQAHLNGTALPWLAKTDVANTDQTTQPSVTPSPKVPEFPTWIILLLAVTTALIAFTIIGKKKLNQSTS